jgi:hypothetical protein
MANEAPVEAKKRTRHPKPKVMRAALLLWAHRIYHAADDAVKAAGGYAGHKEDPARFKVYADIFKEMRAMAEKFDALANQPSAAPGPAQAAITPSPQNATSQSVLGGCEDDQDCPDDQICVHGTCEPLFPQD